MICFLRFAMYGNFRLQDMDTIVCDNISQFYPRRINEQYKIRKDKFVIVEHDIIVPFEIQKLLSHYIEANPDRVHCAPYVHYDLNVNAIIYPRILQNFCGDYTPLSLRGVQANTALTCDKEADLPSLGCTYIPKKTWCKAWDKVDEAQKNGPNAWINFDTALALELFAMGERAIVHWDCFVSHLRYPVA